VNVLSTVLEVAGLIAVCVAAAVVSPVLGLFVTGVCLFAVGWFLED
jgi:ammonia channel protein AmtB